ncbi:MAG: helix-turn-helix transcriptional regulator [Acidobacteriota bacterium]|nr:helix-turn-helix transcriptional regulator [Acidobacteriota bacterium]
MMTTTLTIREAAEKRGITSSYQLMKALNIPPGHASKLWKGEMRMIGLDTVDNLCAALKCKPNDLIRYEPNAGK